MNEKLEEKLCPYVKICQESKDSDLCKKDYELKCWNYLVNVIKEVKLYYDSIDKIVGG